MRLRVRAQPGRALAGAVAVPGDKSVSHRALIFGALGAGDTVVTGFSGGDDNRRTAAALRDFAKPAAPPVLLRTILEQAPENARKYQSPASAQLEAELGASANALALAASKLRKPFALGSRHQDSNSIAARRRGGSADHGSAAAAADKCSKARVGSRSASRSCVRQASTGPYAVL